MAKTILLVEDREEDELLTLRSLAKVKLANVVDVVRDGQQALDYLFRVGEYRHLHGIDLPAIVMLDVNLPRVNGLDVLKAVRSNEATRLLPIVMLTSSDEESDRLRSYKDGANSFVRKPVEFGQFAETVASLGLYWLTTNVPPNG